MAISYMAGVSKRPDEFDEAETARPNSKPETIDERRNRLRESFKNHKRQSLFDILAGSEPTFIDDDEAIALADSVEFEKPGFNAKLWNAVQTCREEGFQFERKGKSPVAPKGDEEIESPFGAPRRLDYLLDYDTENDPNNVIGNRWICKGRAFIFVSQSGVGKSSIMAQFSLGWALKRTDLTFGIEPVRPLRQMIVQAENDDGDISEPVKGITEGFELSRDDVRKASRLVEWHEIVGLSGDDFLDFLEDELEARIAKDAPIDICWIDPLNNFIGGDISRIQETKPFTERLDVIGRKLGTIFAIIHHTGKPSKDEREITPSDLAYSMLGSSGLTNWAREVVVLKREHVEEGEPPTFTLTATKRRKKAGMVTLARDGEGGTGKPTETIYVRHASDGSIRWEQCPAPDSEEKPRKGKKAGRPKGRPSSLTDAQRLDIADAVDKHGGYPIPVDELNQLARKVGKTPETVRSYLKKADEARKTARKELIAEGAIKVPKNATQDAADMIADSLLEDS